MINSPTLTLPDLEHKWQSRLIVNDGWRWVCKVCGNVTRAAVANSLCPTAALAWGRQMREAGAEVERSAIVRHLIDRAEDVRSSPAVMDFTNQLATEIESLEHNKEG